LYVSTPAVGGGPVNPAAVGVAMLLMLRYVSGLKVAVCATGKPGEANGFAKLDWVGLTIVPVGESGSLRLNGVGPLGNSHCVDCVGR
jgi:hypothetical protein